MSFLEIHKKLLTRLQQLSYYFPDKTMWQSFVCAMVAAVTLQAFNPFRTGKLVLYQVTYSTGWHGFEMVPFAILGIVGVCYVFQRGISEANRHSGTLRRTFHQAQHEDS
jgi:H+/Cl- antiporter ClcA